MAGLLADRFGIKKVYLLSLFGFAAASALRGLPTGASLASIVPCQDGLMGLEYEVGRRRQGENP